MYKNYLKRIFDFTISSVLLIIALPVFILTTVALYFFNNGNVFFVQKRPGYNENIFSLYKFKTMNDHTDSKGNLLSDEDRLTFVGRIVRKMSIDELPQLINVIKGDMSLIGPRPWLMEYLPLYNSYQRRRQEVRPGITGWAQVNGRNMVDWDKRFEYDIYYVDNLSFRLDLKIFFLTIWNIIAAKGISEEGSATMSKFEGNS